MFLIIPDEEGGPFVTHAEALSRIELLTRERDAATLQLCAEMNWPTPVQQAAIEDYHIREFLQRPGCQVRST